jgi:hypothetical protein
MQITGKVEFISTLEKGSDKNGKAFEKAYFVVNDGSGQYPNKYKIELFNKTELMKGVKVGSAVTVSTNSNVNEWQGKHYGSLMAYKIEQSDQAPAQTHTPQASYDAVPIKSDPVNDLPF